MVNPLSNPAYLLPPLAAVFFVVILTLIVYIKTRHSPTTLLFCSMLLSITISSLLVFGMRSSLTTTAAAGWERFSFAIFPATFVFFYHFTLAYTNNKGQRIFMIGAYLYILIIASLAPTDILLTGMRLEPYGYAPTLGPLAVLTFLGMPLLMMAATYNLVKRYRTTPSEQEKNRLLYLIIALVFPLTGAILDAFSNLPPMFIWGNLIFAVVCTVAIVKYRLLDIAVMIRKSLVYLLISIIVAVPYVGALLLIDRIFKARAVSWLTGTLTILFLAIALRPLYSWAQRIVDRLFYRARYDFLKALEDFSVEVHSIRDSELLKYSLVKLTSQALQSSNVLLLLYSDSGYYDLVSSAKESPIGFRWNRQSTLVQWLQSNKRRLHRRDLSIIPQLRALTASEVSELEKIKAELFVPITTKKDELIGILILGQKLSQQSYSEEDERLLSTVASRVAVELENARLYTNEAMMRRELEKESESKTEFLHSVAHELKTPLTAIISSSELLDEADQASISPNQRERLINNIAQSAWSMNNRVTELLDLARVQTGEVQLQLQPLDIGSTIKELASQFLILFEKKKQSLKLEIPDYLPQVKADRNRFEQILVNLLSNANKFSPNGGNITLRAKENKNDHKVIVEVEDSAPVVAEEEKRKLFTPYYRGDDRNRKEQTPGLGLGLSISKSLVELHKGEIWVDSKAGEGNIFAFSLPALQQRIEETS